MIYVQEPSVKKSGSLIYFYMFIYNLYPPLSIIDISEVRHYRKSFDLFLCALADSNTSIQRYLGNLKHKVYIPSKVLIFPQGGIYSLGKI